MALKIWKTRSTFAALSLMLAITSCQREALVEDVTLATQEATLPLETPELAELEQPMAETRSAVQYYFAPAVGTYTPNSLASETLPGHNGMKDAYGGVIRARVVSQTNDTFIVEFSKQDGTTFGDGKATLRASTTCGGDAGQVTVSATSQLRTIRVEARAYFTRGITHFYPVFESSVNGNRYYAEPVMVYTSPMYNIKSSYQFGEEIATVNGVRVKAAGKYLISDILSVQCTEFCHRYYREKYGKNIVHQGDNGGHAYTWYDAAHLKGLRRIPHGETPRVGDILCFGGVGDISKLGHVMIIIEVGNNYIKVAHQNSSIVKPTIQNYDTAWKHAVGGAFKYNPITKIITPPSGFTVQGFLRL